MKLRFMILLAILITLVGAWCAFGQTPPLSAMQKNYDYTNSAYFGDKLTHEVVIKYTPSLKVDGQPAMAATTCISTVNVLHCLIELDPATNNTMRTASLSEDHEMCHIKLWGQLFDIHSGKFQDCMKDLAAQDAFWDVW